MMRLTFNNLQKYDIPYDRKKIIGNIVTAQHSKNDKTVMESKLYLFQSMNKIVVKNINNFFYLIRNFEQEPLYTRDDLVGECFIIMNKCVKSFNTAKFKDFHWFYNKSLTRGLIRILEKSYLKHLKNNGNASSPDRKSVSQIIQPRLDFSDYYLEKIGLTNKEKKILKSKMDMVRIKDFVKANKNISESEYYKLFNNIKVKIKPYIYELSN